VAQESIVKQGIAFVIIAGLALGTLAISPAEAQRRGDRREAAGNATPRVEDRQAVHDDGADRAEIIDIVRTWTAAVDRRDSRTERAADARLIA